MLTVLAMISTIALGALSPYQVGLECVSWKWIDQITKQEQTVNEFTSIYVRFSYLPDDTPSTYRQLYRPESCPDQKTKTAVEMIIYRGRNLIFKQKLGTQPGTSIVAAQKKKTSGLGQFTLFEMHEQARPCVHIENKDENSFSYQMFARPNKQLLSQYKIGHLLFRNHRTNRQEYHNLNRMSCKVRDRKYLAKNLADTIPGKRFYK